MAKNYINNKQFYEELCQYLELCKEKEREGLPRPQVPNYIGECFISISNRLSNKANFAGYTYKDEMIGDAIENCLNAVYNFDPEKSQNPFSYFTQIIWFAFLRRIEKEKKQTYIKYKTLEQYVIDESMEEEIGAYTNFDIGNEKMNPIIEKFEKKGKKKPAKKGVEKFYE